MIKLKKILKIILKFTNYYFLYFFYQKKYQNIKFKKCHVFFGYHDKINLNSYNKILLHKVYKSKDNQELMAEVGYYDLLENELKTFDTTSAWSWQLGSQLQWIGNTQNVIYNSYYNNEPVSKIYSPKNNSVLKFLPYHIFNTSNNGEIGIFIDFIRLGNFRRGYGYNNKKVNQKYNGFKLLNISNSSVIFDYSIEQICKQVNVLYSKDLYLNHFVFSPDDKKISFYLINNKNKNRFVTLIIFDIENNFFIRLKELNQVSHLCWKNNEEILVTSSKDLKKFNLVKLNLKKREKTFIEKFMNGHDFHLMINPVNQNLLLIDYYPNLFNLQIVLVYDLENNKILLEEKIKSHWSNSGYDRCDLHSKWNINGDKILIDLMSHLKREIKIINYLF